MKTSAEIKQEVINKLRKDPLLASENIEADVICGSVFLEGKVDCYRKKFEAGKRIRSMRDIKAVHNDLYVDLPADDKRTDAEIKDALRNTLQSDINAPQNKISFSVYDGIIILTGNAGNKLQKDEIMNVAATVPGVLNVWNFIKVENNVINNADKDSLTAAVEISADDLVAV